MPAFEVPKGEVRELMEKMGIGPEGYAVRLANDSTIVLLHYKTRHEVIISKGDRPTW